MSSISKVDALTLLVGQLSLQIMWTIFALFHLSLVVAGLVALWIWQIPPQIFAAQCVQFAQSLPALLAGILGVSALSILALWVRIWRRVYARFATPKLFRDIENAMRS